MKKINVKILCAHFKEMEELLNKYLNEGYKINGNIIHEECGTFYVLLIQKI